MSFYYFNTLRYYSFELFENEPIQHGVFSRRGGVSPAPWSSLNTSGLSGDSRENVIENRRRIFSVFNRSVDSTYDVWQVHSAEVVIADRPRSKNIPHQKADAIITNNPEVTLFMLFGDCVPILLFDPIRRVVAIAHAGWQGTVKNVVGATVQTMRSHFQCVPEDILAGIGPSICVNHYEFGGDPIEEVRREFGERFSEVLHVQNGKSFFDLWKANQISLTKAGLLENHIQVSGLCTAENCEDWYSHRAEHGKTGRFGTILALK